MSSTARRLAADTTSRPMHMAGAVKLAIQSSTLYLWTDPSSKIDVRRLNAGDLLIQICVHCLVFLVLGGRDQRPSSPATAAS